MSNAFSTINAARAIRERHPDATPSTAHVAIAMATFANGRSGASIRPGVANLAALTGLHPDTVQCAIQWLVARGELRRDKPGHRGSAACFTWVGGMQGSDTPPIERKEGSELANARVSHPSHQPNQQEPSGALPGTPSGVEGHEAPHPQDSTQEDQVDAEQLEKYWADMRALRGTPEPEPAPEGGSRCIVCDEATPEFHSVCERHENDTAAIERAWAKA
jgi:hypothetical protein